MKLVSPRLDRDAGDAAFGVAKLSVIGCRLHLEFLRNVEVTRLVDLDLNFVLKRFLESGSLDNNLIRSGQKIKRVKQAVGIRGERCCRTPGDVRDFDCGARHSRAVRVHYSSGYLAS